MKGVRPAAVLFLASIMANNAFAATVTGNLTVTANVVQACIITSVNDISFGDYNPASGAPKDGQGSFTFSCLGGTNYELYINGARQMAGPSANYLNYDLYTDAGKSNLWPSAKPSSENGVTTDASPITRNVYGRIPAGQYLPAGSYTNIVSIVVDF